MKSSSEPTEGPDAEQTRRPLIELAGVFGMTLTVVPDRVGRTFRVIGLDQDVTTHATARAAELARRMPAG
ncbi:hypothetical protein ACFYP4_09725 [Streptomyces sp. NPDC005551]|uniref:hypothetical protein n=1 Tax=Streptomyces sp. NPDC005551 TaxID=3364725 RepID=UPI0036C64DAC